MTDRQFVLGPEFDSFEDDVPVGPSWHQDAIVALSDSLEYCGPHRGLPWLVGNRLTMIVSRQAEEHPAPDILVHPTLTAAPRIALDIEADGPPVLAIEVVSTAAERDRDLNVTEPGGTPQLYAAVGIREYLAFDPLAELIQGQVRAWHLSPNRITPWLPAAPNGRWLSPALGVSFAVQGALLRFYDQDGQLAPIYREALHTIAALQAELRRLRGQ